MNVRLHPHAKARLAERGATEDEVVTTVERGERFPAKLGRVGFRRIFPFDALWHGRHFRFKKVEAFAVQENGWLVITVIVKYFG
jgi:hypothetical protein